MEANPRETLIQRALTRLPHPGITFPRRDIFSNVTFHLRSSHPVYPYVEFIVWSQGGVMIARRELAGICLVDPEDEDIPANSVSLDFLKDCLEIRQWVDAEEYFLNRPEPVFTQFPVRDGVGQGVVGRPVAMRWEEFEVRELVTLFDMFPYDWGRIRRASTALQRFSTIDLVQQWGSISQVNRMRILGTLSVMEIPVERAGDATREVVSDPSQTVHELEPVSDAEPPELLLVENPVTETDNMPSPVEANEDALAGDIIEASVIHQDGTTEEEDSQSPVQLTGSLVDSPLRSRSPRNRRQRQRRRLWTDSEEEALVVAYPKFQNSVDKFEKIRSKTAKLNHFTKAQIQNKYRDLLGDKNKKKTTGTEHEPSRSSRE